MLAEDIPIHAISERLKLPRGYVRHLANHGEWRHQFSIFTTEAPF